MRRDLEMLERVEVATTPQSWLRFYRWERPTVSLGKHQRPELAVDLDYCREHSIPWVRRPTGGRAVLHGDELTYAVASNDVSRFPGDLVATYLAIARALEMGLSSSGVQAEIAPSVASGADRGAPATPCFMMVSSHELTVGGRKVAGSAQRRTKGGFLQHGSIPLTLDYQMMEGVFGMPAQALESRFTSLAEAGSQPPFGRLAEALATAFEEIFDLVFKPAQQPGIAAQ